MREWLTIIIVLLIFAVLLDGWRRMRKARRESIRMSSLSMHKGLDGNGTETFGSELPTGGARVVDKRDEEDRRALTQAMQIRHRRSRITVGMNRIPQQVTLGLDESAPELDNKTSRKKKDKKPRVEPTFGKPAQAEGDWEMDEQPQPIAESLNTDEQDEEELDPLFAPTKPIEASDPAPELAQDELFPEPGEETDIEVAEEEIEAEPDEVLVINVMAPGGKKFRGQELLDVVLECDLRYGEMQIFHRHEDSSGSGPHLFSMINMVKPGTFDLDSMAEFETPGVSLFMTLPMKANSVQAFNTMALTANTLAEKLGGELKDETRSAMTNQTLEHCRQRILEYERKRQLAGAH